MEHIEEAGVHSGDSCCAIPPYSLPGPVIQEIREATIAMAKHLRVVGLMNVQFAVKREDGKPVVYVLEVNPRASRTVPFVAKATGVPLAKIAAKVMTGKKLPQLGLTQEPIPAHVSVKESVFPFRKFAGVDIVLGPEMRSTGEVMGVSERFSIAFAKAQLAGGTVLPTEGKIFLSVSKRDKDAAVDIARRLAALGHEVVATEGTAQRLEAGGIGVTRVRKLSEGRPNVLDLLNDGQIGLVINTPSGKGARTDEGRIRAAAVQLGVSCITTLQAAEAAVKAMEALREEEMGVQALQDRFPKSPIAEVTGQEVLT
jgi:carbamoyl-phosphate synthase large subunit